METVFGFKISALIAGLLGGFIRPIVVGGGWWAGVVSAFVGAISSAYFSPWLTFSKVNYLEIPEGTVGFLVGLVGMSICEGVIKLGKLWAKSPSFPPFGDKTP